MEPSVVVLHGFAEAARADAAYYAGLSPQQRLDLLLEMIAQHREAQGEAAARLERVHRVVELSRR